MFTLRIHTIDFPQQLNTTVTFAADNAIDGDDDVKPAELMGVAHLFRQLPMTASAAVFSTVANIGIRTTLVFVVAVPNYMATDDFLIFCGPHLSSFTDILFLRLVVPLPFGVPILFSYSPPLIYVNNIFHFRVAVFLIFKMI